MTKLIKNLSSSTFGIIVCLGIFILSLGLIFSNENQFNEKQLALLSKSFTTQELQNTNLDTKSLLAISGQLLALEDVGDNLYLSPAKYVAVKRIVEVYSANGQNPATDNEAPTCKTEWLDTFPTESSGKDIYCQPVAPDISSQTFVNHKIHLDQYPFDFEKTGLPSYQPLILDSQIVNFENPDTDTTQSNTDDTTNEMKQFFTPNYVFLGKGSLEQPEIGDIRISYQIIAGNQMVTIFGTVQNGVIVAYKHDDGQSFYKLKMGDYSQSLNNFTERDGTSLWLYRISGLIGIWVCLTILLSPVQKFLLSTTTRFLSRRMFILSSFLLSAVITTFVVYFSIIVKNLLLLIVVLFAVGLGVASYFYFNNQKSKKNQSDCEPEQIIDRQVAIQYQANKIYKTRSNSTPKITKIKAESTQKDELTNTKKKTNNKKTSAKTPKKIKKSQS